jgi:hypothetical protein
MRFSTEVIDTIDIWLVFRRLYQLPLTADPHPIDPQFI